MEKFNEIRNKFEQGFTPTEEEVSAAFNATDHADTKNLTQQTPRKRSRSKPLRPLADPEYVNIDFLNEKPLEPPHLNRSTRKKKPRRVRAKQLEVLPSIYENLSENFSNLDLSHHEYENIQAVAVEPTEYFLPDSTSATNLDRNELLAHKDSTEDYEEFVINNELYESFFQRIGESPTDYFTSSNTIATSQPFANKTSPTAKENFSEIQESTTNSASDSVIAKNKFRKLKKLKKNRAAPLLISQENEEPIFGDITKINPDGTIEWQTWYPPTSQSDSLKSKQSGLKLSKFLPDKICFWRAPDTADSEEKETRPAQLRK
ncbi:hypothetical protein [Rickettsiella endosymbiont of Aleochara curtula]|uniref:hypothetical protein n=1 Tax=Rickettsiella endosymbiont of Aleochara curtula TaxID=3077936 RepID=UPI00313D9DE9